MLLVVMEFCQKLEFAIFQLFLMVCLWRLWFKMPYWVLLKIDLIFKHISNSLQMETGELGVLCLLVLLLAVAEHSLKQDLATILLLPVVVLCALDLILKACHAMYRIARLVKKYLICFSSQKIWTDIFKSNCKFQCIADGNWGAWTSFSACNVTCGGGTQSKTRLCNNPAPSNGGNMCPGSHLESLLCNVQNCPISKYI